MELTDCQADDLDQEPVLIEWVTEADDPACISQYLQYRSGDHGNAESKKLPRDDTRGNEAE